MDRYVGLNPFIENRSIKKTVNRMEWMQLKSPTTLAHSIYHFIEIDLSSISVRVVGNVVFYDMFSNL